MFRVGRQKTIWLRATARLGVFLTLTVAVRPAFGWSLFDWGAKKSTPAEAPPPPAKPAPPAAPPLEMVRGRVAPTSVRIDAASSGSPISANNPWRLFDGDGVVGFIAGGPTRIRAALPAGTVFEGIGAYGASAATLTVYADEGGKTPLKGLDHVSLAGLPLRWNRFEVASAIAAEGLLIEVDPASGGQADVRELEIWGSTPARAPTAPGSVAEALLTGLPPSAVSVAASPGGGEMSYPKLGPDGAATFRVDLTEEAMALSRAFLVYDLEGLPHWSAARRRINGLTISGGVHAHRAAGGLQVEEISPAWLRAGTNEIQFLAANLNDPIGYKVKNLRVVVVPAAGDAPAYVPTGTAMTNAVRALVDGRSDTGVGAKDVGDGLVVDLKFPTPSQPDSLILATDAGERLGTVTIDPVVQGKVQRSRRVTARLQDLKPGWARIPLDATPTEADGVRVTVQSDDERPIKGRIAEMRVTGSPRPAGEASSLTVSYPLSGECVDGEAYVLGFLRPDGTGTLAGTKLKIDGAVQSKAVGPDGAFSAVLPPPAGARNGKKWQIAVEADFSNGDVVQRPVDIEGCRPPEVAKAPTGPVEDQGAPYGAWVHPGKATTLSFAGATLEIPAGAVTEDTRITVRPLGDVQVPATDDTLTNVTIGAQAYRFGPHGMKFAKPVNLTVPYDRFRFPSGMSEEDLGVFFFDEAVGKWHQVQTVKGSAMAHTMTAASTHFTDFIAATIASPDHPTADSFNPNSIKDMKAPDPAAMIDVIQPPTASPDGAAHLSYPLWVPAGRQGMQPNLSVNYNSSGGNGLLGLGWELSLSSIEVDTRFGVPTYDPNNETESYSLDGELLVPDAGQQPRSGTRTFHRRSEGKFDTIIRTGAGPYEGGVTAEGQSTAGYNWEVVTLRGMHYFYGSSFDSRGSLVGRGAYRWYLDHVEDAFGNQVLYGYRKSVPPYHTPIGTGACAEAVEIYPASISYTADSNGANAFYRVDFELNGDGISLTPGDGVARPDPSSNARGGTIALMSRRLVNIRVFQTSQPSCTAGCTNTTYIRRYNFQYQTGEYGKSLLSAIRACVDEDHLGPDSPGFPAEFYHHTFTYSSLLVNPLAQNVAFSQPQTWSTGVASSGLSNTSSESLNGTLAVGAGPGGCDLFHVAVGGSTTLNLPIPLPSYIPHNNQDTTVRSFVDVNGDGLPDIIGTSSNSFLAGAFQTGPPIVYLNNAGKKQDSFTPPSTAISLPTNGTLEHDSRFSVSWNAGAHELFETAHQSIEHIWSSSHQDTILTDIDGDGFVDQLVGGSALLNTGGGFTQSATWTSPTLPSFMPGTVLAAQKAAFTLTDPTMAWTAPFTGHVRITGAIQKAPNTVATDDGVTVLIQQYTGTAGIFAALKTAWTQTIQNSNPCIPSDNPSGTDGTNDTGCNVGNGRNLYVTVGDRIYFRADSIDDINDDTLAWNPQISYTDTGTGCASNGSNCQQVTSDQRVLEEPFGVPAFDFDQATDFRLADHPISLWKDESAGSVQIPVMITGTFQKKATSDAVTVHLFKIPNGQDPPTLPVEIALPAPFSAPFAASLDNAVAPNAPPPTLSLPVSGLMTGDRLYFEISSPTPIDPNQISFSPLIQYSTYCRPNNIQSNTTATSTQALLTSYEMSGSVCGMPTGCDSSKTTSCTIQGDTAAAANPVSPDIIFQNPPPYFPVPNWKQFGLPAGFTAPSAGTITFTGRFTGSGPLANARLVAHSPNRLLFDGTPTALQLGQTTNAPAQAPTPINVKAGETVLFDVYDVQNAGPISDSATWTVNLQFNGVAQPNAFAARRNYLVEATIPPPAGTDPGGGAFHGWTYFEWSDSTSTPASFNETEVENAFVNGVQVTSEGDSTPPVRLMSAKPGGIPAGQQNDPPAIPGPVWRGPSVDGYIAAGALKPSREGKASDDPFAGSIAFSTSSSTNTVAGVGFIFSIATNFGEASTNATQTQLIDMNGDRYPDLVQNQGISFNHVTNPGQVLTTVKEGGAFSTTLSPIGICPVPITAQQTCPDNQDLRDSVTNQVTASLGISTPTTVQYEGHPPAWTSVLPTLGIGFSDTSTLQELLDINGDGLPDYVTRNPSTGEIDVRYNVGVQANQLVTGAPPANQFTDPVVLGTFAWETGANAGAAPQITSSLLSFVDGTTFENTMIEATNQNPLPLHNEVSVTNNIGVGYSYFGGGLDASATTTTTDMIDVNGDGLPDIVARTPQNGTMSIKFNTGDGFLPEQQWNVPAWQLPSGESLQQSNTVGLGSTDALAFNETSGGSFSAGYPFYFETIIAGCYGFELGIGAGQTTTGSEMRFEDVDGDGAPDQVLKINGDPNVYVRSNPATQFGSGVNLLQSVSTPVGGVINLTYATVGHVVDQAHQIDMPDHQYVLTSVMTNDQMPDFQNQIQWNFDYTDPALGETSGFYSRDEREFFGFGHVRSTNGNIQIDRTYDTTTYPRRHLLLTETTSDSTAQMLYRQTANHYDDRAVVAAVPGVSRAATFPALTSKTISFYEGLTNNINAPVKTTNLTYNYNNVGLVSNFVDFGDVGTADDINFVVNYATDPDPLGSVAQIYSADSVQAFDGSGNLLRARNATFESHGLVQTITDSQFGGKDVVGNVYQITNNTNNPTSSFTYDSFGNLHTSTDPTGYELTYTYDSQRNTYISTIQDSFGYSSSRTYDLNFGHLSDTTDVNEQTQHLLYDRFGRVQYVFAPQDSQFWPVNVGNATVQYQYAIAGSQNGNVGTMPFYALTQTKDLARTGGTLDRVVFLDGSGRVRQLKKSATVSGVDGLLVSGKLKYDSVGREFEEGFPFSEQGKSTETVYDTFLGSGTTGIGTPAKTFAYDVLNRTRMIQTPDNKGPDKDPSGDSVVTTMFSFQSATLDDGVVHLVKVAKDPQGKVRTDFISPREEVLAVQETNTLAGQLTPTVLTTHYTYDGLSELLQVKDPNGNLTTAAYDSLGNMIKLVSPDSGQTEWRHYASGLLAAKETANLRSAGQLVTYGYDVNRLKTITYPTAAEKVTYTYGLPGAANGQANRIASVTDESGTEVRFYDQLGNVSQTQRTPTPQSTSIPKVTYTMGYSYDTVGRVLSMTYPDNEVVTYGYDAGGKPVTVTAKRNGTSTEYVTNVIYNNLEQRVLIGLANGFSSNYFYYTDTKRLQSVVTKSSAIEIQNIGYGYDLVGNITGVSNNLPTLAPVAPNTVVQPGPTFQTFGYDDLYQLTSSSGQYTGCACGCANSRFFTLTNQYDGLGNIVRKTQSDVIVPPGGGNQVQAATSYDNVYKYSTSVPSVRPHAPTTIGNETISYDFDGNMQGTNGTFGPSRAFTWTEDDRLRMETDSGFSNTYLYDADGNRTHKRRTSIETWYVNPNYVVKGYTTETKHIMLGDERVVSEMATISTFTNPTTAGASTVFYYHPDHLQSTSYTTGSDGSILQHDEYFPSGEVWFQEAKNSDSRNTQPYLFNAKELDETGLYAFGARYYNPKYSIWSNPDPMLATNMQGRDHMPGIYAPRNLALYTYSWNNPVVLQDPDGRDTIIVSGPGRADLHQTPGWYVPARDNLANQLVRGGLSPDRVHVVSSKAAATAASRQVEKTGRKVSGVVFAGHGNDGQLMTESNPGNFADTSLSDMAHAAHVAKGGVAVSFACDSAAGENGEAQMDALHAEGIGAAGWESLVHLDSEGGFANGGDHIPIGSARPPDVTAPAQAGASVTDMLLSAEKRVNKDLGTARTGKESPPPRRHQK